MKISGGILAAAFIGLAASYASAQTVVPSDLNSFLAASNASNEIFTSKIRYGGTGFTHAMDTNGGNQMSGTNGTNNALKANNGVAVPFTLTYGGGSFVMNVGGNIINGSATGSIDQLWFKVRNGAPRSGTTDMAISVNNLLLNGSASLGSLAASFNEGEKFWQLSGATLGTSFTLSGDITMTWDGQNPRDESLRFETVAFSTIIPLPGAAGMALAGMGMIGLRRRR